MKSFYMKPFFTLILSCLMFAAFSQTFNNEWIKYNQTYYKFRIGKEGVYRIPKTLLDAAGIGNTQVQNFELWRNGKKVPVYSSVTTGNLPADGYLEFWGMPNDGEPDKQLYRDPNFQHTTKTSLQSDTANYFLSVNSDQSGLLVSNQPNNVASNTLPVEKYFMHVAGTYYKERMNLGNALIVGEYIYSSSYDKGEYWSTNFITPATPRITTISNLNVYPAGPSSQIRFGANGNSLNSRTIRVSVNDNLLLDTLTEYFYDVLDTIDFPTSLITSNAASVKFTNNSTISSDRLTVSFFELVYPRTFDFGGLKNFEFSLPADLDGYYLEITNFNAGAQAPVLYDLSSAVRYVADQGVLGKLRFVLPPASGTRRFMLVSQDPSNITLISNFSSKQFVNYNLTANQGNYIIISHPYLNVGTNGRKPLDEYKAYRSSASGGSYQVVFANIDELVDQFAFGIDKHPLSVRNFLKFARAKFNSPVKYCFLIGRGMTYNEYRMNNSDTLINKLNTVPTFGTPASDNLLSAESLLESIPATPIGRLAVVRGSEIEDYLQKLIEYEAVQKNAPNTMAGRAWMKNILHVTGASDPYLGVVLCDYMSVYKELIQDTLMGSKVITFCKNSTNPNDLVTNEEIKRYFAEGMSALTYFGHSSATTLEFNIENTQDYNNQGKYPVFFVNGCNAGNFFTYYPQRMIVNETL